MLSKAVRIRSGRGGGRSYLAKLNQQDKDARADAAGFKEHLQSMCYRSPFSIFNEECF